MAPRSRRQDAAELGHRIWDHLRGRAGNLPAEFTPDTRDDVTGWLWEGAAASLIGEAIPAALTSDCRPGGRLSPSVAALPCRRALRMTAQADRKAARPPAVQEGGWAIP